MAHGPGFTIYDFRVLKFEVKALALGIYVVRSRGLGSGWGSRSRGDRIRDLDFRLWLTHSSLQTRVITRR